MSGPFETRIDRLRLENFRLFKSMEIDFHPQLTVLTAPNGGGKTAVLDAIAASLQMVVEGIAGGSGAHALGRHDVRLERSPAAKMVAVLPLRTSGLAYFGGVAAPWERRIENIGKKAKATTRGASALTAAGLRYRHLLQEYATESNRHAPLLPVIGYYGTGRLWSQHKLTEGKRKKSSNLNVQTDAYLDSLSPSASFRAFKNWFFSMFFEAAKVSRGSSSLHNPLEMYKVVAQAVDIAIAPSGWGTIDLDQDLDAVTVRNSAGMELAVDFMSDGIRIMVALVADIAHRAARLNPGRLTKAALESPGIVMIDEIDLHLHPAWQQTVISALTTAFPKIQFIVTTHSPQVLSTVDHRSIRVLHADGTVSTPPRQTKGVESPDVLAAVMGVHPIPPVLEAKWVRDYQALIEQDLGESVEATELRAKIIGHFGEQHPVVADCDRMLRWQKFKATRAARATEG